MSGNRLSEVAGRRAARSRTANFAGGAGAARSSSSNSARTRSRSEWHGGTSCYRRERVEAVPPASGYTSGMKTAVSIPDEVFDKVERLARGAGRSRSEVYSAALVEYVARHAPDEVTEAMDRVCERVGAEAEGDAFVSAAGRRILERTEW